jgi:hypothetical protein
MNGYESVGLIPLSSYFDRSDVLGGMHPDQTYTSATQGEEVHHVKVLNTS